MRTRLAARRGATLVVAALAGLVLVVGGCSPAPADRPAAGGHDPAAGAPVRSPAPDAETGGTDEAASAAAARPDVPVRPARDTPAPAPPAPVRVAVPDLGIDMPVVPEGVDDQGRMALPGDALTAGWYRHGPAPASPAGATVVAAHVDDPVQVGPFARLREAGEGTSVDVVDAAGTTHRYTVTRVETVPKSAFPAGTVFDRAGTPRIVLVTCGGRWDRQQRSYTENVVVTAERTDGA
ncbi:class F sortase [Cellulosimicrobium sp. NPDC057127]|uniref:class F sortase n=1 Tax=Cellulosimicrobium sp. NPDC057127 TaxID=3346026 RepID=UPI00363AC98D